MFSTSIKQPFVTKIIVFSIFEWPFFTGFTVCIILLYMFAIIECNIVSLPI